MPSTENRAARAGLRPDWAPIVWFTVCHAIGLIGPFYFFSWSALGVCIASYCVIGLFGITLGYHRLFSHRAFKVPLWVERTLAVVGSLALQKGPLDWVSHHRMHHAGVDTDRDPHDASRGFWWSHVGWMLFKNEKVDDPAVMKRFARDMAVDPFILRLNDLSVHVGLQVAFAALLFALGGVPFVVWGVFTRLVLLYNMTWFVNSASHMWGYRTYASNDRSRNCWWVGLLIFGEGWHNNHHAHPDLAQAGHRPWELDATWQVIRLMRRLGIATSVRVLEPSAAETTPAR